MFSFHRTKIKVDLFIKTMGIKMEVNTHLAIYPTTLCETEATGNASWKEITDYAYITQLAKFEYNAEIDDVERIAQVYLKICEQNCDVGCYMVEIDGERFEN